MKAAKARAIAIDLAIQSANTSLIAANRTLTPKETAALEAATFDAADRITDYIQTGAWDSASAVLEREEPDEPADALFHRTYSVQTVTHGREFEVTIIDAATTLSATGLRTLAWKESYLHARHKLCALLAPAVAPEPIVEPGTVRVTNIWNGSAFDATAEDLETGTKVHGVSGLRAEAIRIARANLATRLAALTAQLGHEAGEAATEE